MALLNSVVPKSENAHEARVASARDATPSTRPKPLITEDPPPTKHPALANGTLSISMALAFAQHLGLTDADIAAVLEARCLTLEEGQFSARVDGEALARAYTPAVTRALSDPHCPIALQSTRSAELEAHAARVRATTQVVTKLEAGTRTLELAVRGDADVLDKVTREIVPQIKARAAVVRATEQVYSSVLAYHRVRYPGPTRKTKKPAPDK